MVAPAERSFSSGDSSPDRMGAHNLAHHLIWGLITCREERLDGEGVPSDERLHIALDLRTTTSQKCAVVPRRARI